MCIHGVLFSIWLTLVGSIVAGATSVGHAETLGELWSVEIEPGNYVAALGNLVGDSAEELVLAVDNGIFVYTWDQTNHTYVLTSHVTDVSAPVSALALGDFFAENRRELLVGTSGSGLIRVYRMTDDGLQFASTVVRLWSTVRQIVTVDMDGDGRREIVALSENGDVVALRPQSTGYAEIWRKQGGNNPVRLLTVGDLTGDGLPEIIIAREQGYIGIYGWRRSREDTKTGADVEASWELLHEAFPWGAVRTLDLVDLDRNGKLYILVLTDQGLLYAYGFDDGQWNHHQTWDAGVLLSATELHLLHAYPPDRPIWLGITSEGLKAWEFADGIFTPFWEAPIQPSAVFQGSSGALATIEPGGKLRLLGRVPDDQLRVSVNHRHYELEHPFLLEDGHLWLAARDWQRLLSLRGWFTRHGERWTGVGPGFQLFIVDAGGTTVWVNGRQREISPAARMFNDELYLPVAFADRLGYHSEFEPTLRTLKLTRR